MFYLIFSLIDDCQFLAQYGHCKQDEILLGALLVAGVLQDVSKIELVQPYLGMTEYSYLQL